MFSLIMAGTVCQEEGNSVLTDYGRYCVSGDRIIVSCGADLVVFTT